LSEKWFVEFGLAGEDTPKVVVPSAIGLRKDAKQVSKDSKHNAVVEICTSANKMEIINTIETCAVTDWDAMERLWEQA
jgi:actin-related protein